MTRITVTTQAELDAALNDLDVTYDNTKIVINSPAGVTLVVDDRRGLDILAVGSSTVHVYGSSTVHADDSVAIHEHDPHATIAGGVIIDHTTADHVIDSTH